MNAGCLIILVSFAFTACGQEQADTPISLAEVARVGTLKDQCVGDVALQNALLKVDTAIKTNQQEISQAATTGTRSFIFGDTQLVFSANMFAVTSPTVRYSYRENNLGTRKLPSGVKLETTGVLAITATGRLFAETGLASFPGSNADEQGDFAIACTSATMRFEYHSLPLSPVANESTFFSSKDGMILTFLMTPGTSHATAIQFCGGGHCSEEKIQDSASVSYLQAAYGATQVSAEGLASLEVLKLMTQAGRQSFPGGL